ncbi:MAG: desulfoferrodoxin [Oscillospiraceae bacterium]|nr:desulfoferrodoxin [Oscillospiraceae bacterium]
MKFYVCEHCGNIIEYHKNKGVPVMCCGQKMTLLEPGTTDASVEKHVPVIEQNGKNVVVRIGAAEHPMVEVHYIEWIILETTNGYQKKHLKPGEAPVAEFVLAEGEEVVAAYEYCNLHGLWKK